jgi:Co/Zn/Cd efflux system component
MLRAVLLGLGTLSVFALVAAIGVYFTPGPLNGAAYLVIGSVATLVSLLALFLLLVSTTMKSSEIFFKRRKK